MHCDSDYGTLHVRAPAVVKLFIVLRFGHLSHALRPFVAVLNLDANILNNSIGYEINYKLY